ncbi:double zinc ribbon domain-containing protein [Geomonas subterranea]|uniref:double zinc ribbon domain-containing protein n=1 Tax=Geomonas subterranea TaxID=2847989 RepID=UPI001CD44FAC|nr:zinc ribbon domain-containing protein [Geomonas fuzhouensis]
MSSFDLTPPPNVLIALTHTPIQPMDAICELIDNAIDSFRMSELLGNPVKSPKIWIDLPKPSDIGNGAGYVRVADNGAGMTPEQAANSIRAGFSGNNPFDTLGLFGMGFNIATGKIGRKTRLVTACAQKDQCITVEFDLESLVKNGSYIVPAEISPKPADLGHGTVVEVSNWWPNGHANSGFIGKLLKYGMPKIRQEIGRRYATVLRKKKVQIVLNSELCSPFYHCAWGESRFVTRQGNVTPAVMHIDKLLGAQKRCTSCYSLVPPDSDGCYNCGASSFRSIEERVTGWIGIQRFDDSTEFGLDLIRNGRAIRVGEKNAFFEYVDEFKKTVKDYPIDQPYGRIIGEIHINHVPVDFMKQDFQRSSPEWQRAVSYLRGDSSLQPGQSGAGSNSSPLFVMYNGYRRVRTPGKTDLYMGYWDAELNKPKRISRDVEKEYYQRFLDKEPGYFEDTEWYKQVELAEIKPLHDLIVCPNCQFQNLRGSDICIACGAILVAKTCLNTGCGASIPDSAAACPQCGASQQPEIEHPWVCNLCKTSNDPWQMACTACGGERGAVDPVSYDHLIVNANKSDELSIPGCSVCLPDGTFTSPITVNVFVSSDELKPHYSDNHLPLVVFKSHEISIFIDLKHPLFKKYHVRPEEMVATEVALFLFDSNKRFSAGRYSTEFSLSTLKWAILDGYWSNTLCDSTDQLVADIAAFIARIKNELPTLLGAVKEDVFSELNDGEKKDLAINIMDNGMDISILNSAEYLKFVSDPVLLKLFDRYTDAFFDQKLWSDSFSVAAGLPDAAAGEIKCRIRSTYHNYLDDILVYLKNKSADPIVSTRTRKSLQLLQNKLI